MLLLDMAIRGSIVLAVGLLVCLALRTRAPALRHAVLAVTLAAAPLVAPIGTWLPALEVTLPIRVIEPPRVAARDVQTPAGAVSPVAESGSTPIDVGPAALPPTDAGPDRLRIAALGAWALGTTLLLGSLFVSAVRLVRATRRARPIVDARWTDALASATHAAGLRRTVSLLESPRPDLLATWGWRTP
jgi:hypothetical protein